VPAQECAPRLRSASCCRQPDARTSRRTDGFAAHQAAPSTCTSPAVTLQRCGMLMRPLMSAAVVDPAATHTHHGSAVVDALADRSRCTLCVTACTWAIARVACCSRSSASPTLASKRRSSWASVSVGGGLLCCCSRLSRATAALRPPWRRAVARPMRGGFFSVTCAPAACRSPRGHRTRHASKAPPLARGTAIKRVRVVLRRSRGGAEDVAYKLCVSFVTTSTTGSAVPCAGGCARQ
jgi:hypothetical protein